MLNSNQLGFQIKKMGGGVKICSLGYKYIDGFDNKYIITKDGEVYSFKNKEKKKIKLSLCSKNKYTKGYYKCCLSHKGKRYYFMVHRLVAQYFVDGFFDGAIVNHKDGNTLNNNYQNLEWITQKENLIHSNNMHNQTFKKWSYKWVIISPDGSKSCILDGQGEIREYINNNNLECKFTSLIKHKRSNGYILKLIR